MYKKYFFLKKHLPLKLALKILTKLNNQYHPTRNILRISKSEYTNSYISTMVHQFIDLLLQMFNAKTNLRPEYTR